MEPIERAIAKAKHEQHNWALLGAAKSRKSRQALSPVFTLTSVLAADSATMAQEHIIGDNQDGVAPNVYRTLRGQVLQELAKADRRTLAVTSVGRGEGRTLTALNLAIAISRDVNQTVLLVDADLRNPSIHRRLGISPAHGLDDYLRHGTPIEKCLVNPGMDRLVVLPTRQPLPNCAELLASPQMSALAQELRDRYRDRIVIYDAPPLLSHGDAIGFLPHVDSVLLVVRDAVAKTEDLAKAMDLLKDHHIVGTILNAAA
jgi:protein-tyrosine kinase